MNKAMLALAALNMMLLAQVSRADTNATQQEPSVIMVNAETNEVIRVNQDGVVTPVSNQEVQAIDNQANATDSRSLQPAAFIGGGIDLGIIGGGIGISRCGISVGAHVGPVGAGVGGACRGFWRHGHWHRGYWHHHHGRWAGHWHRMY